MERHNRNKDEIGGPLRRTSIIVYYNKMLQITGGVLYGNLLYTNKRQERKYNTI